MAMIFKVCIRPDPDGPDTAQGWVRADDIETAHELVDNPAAELFAMRPEMQWDGGNSYMYWTRGGA